MMARARECLWCHVSLEGRRPQARWCSVKCRMYYVRQQRRIDRRREHPRCVVCSNPMPYGRASFNLSAVTCSKKCRLVRRRWFNEAPVARLRGTRRHRREVAVRAAMVRWHQAA